MTHRLENPSRVAELSPRSTLERIGLTTDGGFCDVGAGTGIFTFAAAEMTAGPVYAVEISGEMREILRKKDHGVRIAVTNSLRELPSASCGTALLCTVLHELEDVPGTLSGIRRVLTESGTLAVIESHKRRTPMGPPPEHRISEEEAEALLLRHGFARTGGFDLGENFYCLTFRPAEEA